MHVCFQFNNISIYETVVRKGTFGGVVALVSNPTGSKFTKSNSIQPLHVTFDLNLKLR